MIKKKHMIKDRIKVIVLLQLMIMIYSFSGVFSKLAAQEEFLSIKFCLYYGGVILLLFFYAIGWQQVIKHLPLTMAFSNKALGLFWGLIWGRVIFGETITIGKLVGVIVVVIGVILYSNADEKPRVVSKE